MVVYNYLVMLTSIMQFYKTFLILILLTLPPSVAHAYNCGDIHKLVTDSKQVINENNLHNKKYLKQVLHRAADIDQKIRSNEYAQCENLQSAMGEVDNNNTVLLSKLIGIYSWFPISTFGDEIASDAWLIVQHTQDIALQHKVLFIMQNLITCNEANKEHYALLYDRVALNYRDIGIKQKYGTQFTIEGNKVVMEPYDGSIAKIEERRKNLGMQSLQEYEKILKSMFGAS